MHKNLPGGFHFFVQNIAAFGCLVPIGIQLVELLISEVPGSHRQVKLEPPSHLRPGRPGLKILQNSSDGAANATNAGNAGNATDNASVPPPVLELRQVKGNLTCAQPGCAADVLLQVYDPQKDGSWAGGEQFLRF